MTPRQAVIQNGVKMLREFGYPDCDEKNIITDPIYSAFFKSALMDASEPYLPDLKSAADEIIDEINKANQP